VRRPIKFKVRKRFARRDARRCCRSNGAVADVTSSVICWTKIRLKSNEDRSKQEKRLHSFYQDGWSQDALGVYKAACSDQDRCERMSKQSMREEAERLIRETMARKAIIVKQGNTRIETVCGKCGAPNRISAEKGATRVKFACKQCGHKQETL
jgi:hypothetical protein